MSRHIVIFMLFLLFCGFATGPAGAVVAGSGWLVTASGSLGDKETEIQMRLAGDRIRLSIPGRSEEILLDPEAVTLVDHARKTYTRVTFDQLDATLGLVADAMQGARENQEQALKEAMKNMSPEDRARLQGRLDEIEASAERPAIRFDKSGKPETIAGLPAQRMVVLADDKPVAAVWLTSRIPVEPLLAVGRRLRRLAPLQKNIARWQVDALLGIAGFPLRVVTLAGDTKTEVLHVTRAIRRDFAPEAFSPPAGYKPEALNLGDFNR